MNEKINAKSMCGVPAFDVFHTISNEHIKIAREPVTNILSLQQQLHTPHTIVKIFKFHVAKYFIKRVSITCSTII
jgi:hypothetical protein